MGTGAVVGAQLGMQAALQNHAATLLSRHQQYNANPNGTGSNSAAALPTLTRAAAHGGSTTSDAMATALRTADFCKRLVDDKKFNEDVSAFWDAWKYGKMGNIELPVSLEHMKSRFQEIKNLKKSDKAQAIKSAPTDDSELACWKEYARAWRTTPSGKNFIPRRKQFAGHIELAIDEAAGDESLALQRVQEQVDSYKRSISLFIRTVLKTSDAPA